MTNARMIPTRSGKLVDVNATRKVDGGIMGWTLDFDRATNQTVAVSVFIPIEDRHAPFID